MRTLIVYPRIDDDTYWSFSNILPWLGKRSSLIPLGPITVAAVLPAHYDVRVVDMNVETLTDEDIDRAELIMTSSMVVQRASLEELIARVHARGKRVVAGGPHPTQFFEDIPADHLILGEIESGVLDEFLHDLEHGTPRRIYARPVLDRRRAPERAIDEAVLDALRQQPGAVIREQERRPPLTHSPLPRFDLLDADAYVSFAIQTTRGCPHHCTFCNEPALWGHTMRVKRPEQVIAELDAIRDTGFQGSLFIVDDNFSGNRRAVKPLLVAIADFQARTGYPFQLYTEADILLAKDEELLGLMRQAGFTMVFIGLETPDETVLRSMGKHQNLSLKLLDAVQTIQSYGLEVSSGFIVGNDADPADSGERIISFCRDAGIPLAMAGLLSVARGSELYAEYERAGRLLGESTGNNLDATLNYIPRAAYEHNAAPGPDEIRAASERVIADYKHLLTGLYAPDEYFSRCRTLFDHLGPRVAPPRAPRRAELRAFLNSLARQSFGKAYSPAYRSFLAHTLRHHPRHFADAVSLGVKYHHLWTITERITRTPPAS